MHHKLGGVTYFDAFELRGTLERYNEIKELLAHMKHIASGCDFRLRNLEGSGTSGTLSGAYAASLPIPFSPEKYDDFYVTQAVFSQSGSNWNGLQRGFDFQSWISHVTHPGGRGTLFLGTEGQCGQLFPAAPSNQTRFRAVPVGSTVPFRAISDAPPASGTISGELNYVFCIYSPPYKYHPGGKAPTTADDCTPGSGKAIQNSAHFTWSLGTSFFGGRSSAIELDYEYPFDAWYSPNALTVSELPGFKATRDPSHQLLQAYGPKVVVNVTVLSSSAYRLEFYERNPSWTVGVNGAITTAGSPYVTYEVGNPDSTGLTKNRLRITKDPGMLAEEWSEFAYDATLNMWELSKSNDSVVETFSKSETNGSGEYTTERIKTVSGSTLVSHLVTTWKKYPWADEKILEESDPNGSALTTVWSYFDNSASDGDNYGMPKLRYESSGEWTRFTYDSLKRVKKIVSCLLDQLPTADEDDCKVVEFTYPGDTSPATDLTMVVEKQFGVEVCRRYTRHLWDGIDDILCQTPGALPSAADNLVTETRYYLGTAFAGKVKSIRRPDGTVTLYSYSVDQISSTIGIEEATELTITIKEGVPNLSGTDIIDGTVTNILTDVTGVVLATTVQDVASGLVLVQDTVQTTDGLGRPLVINHLNGKTTVRSYGCCSIDSEVDQLGVSTTFERTAMTSAVRRLGITTRTETIGNISRAIRIGRDHSEIQTMELILDPAGRTVATEDAVGRLQVFNYSKDVAGHEMVVTINSDGGTVITKKFLDGRVLSVSGTAVRPKRYEYGVEAQRLFVKEIILGGEGADTDEWTKTYYDALGRVSLVMNAASATWSKGYSADTGKLIEETDADGVTVLLGYDALGRRALTALDMDRDDVIDYDGSDRITRVDREFANRGGTTVSRVSVYVWDALGLDAPVTIAVSEMAVSGLQSWETEYGHTVHHELSPLGSGDWTKLSTLPDGSSILETVDAGEVVARVLSQGSLVGSSTNFEYDSHGRLHHAVDARSGTTSWTYADDDRVLTVTEPAPASGHTVYVTGFTYDDAGRLDTTTLPDGGVVDRDYWLTGDLKRVSGARSYNEEYTYDTAGRQTTLTTSGGGVTTWNYEATTGYLASKKLHDNTGPAYTYTAGGRVLTRTWERGVSTTYGRDNAGGISSVTYSDATPDVTYTHNRLGRILTAGRDGVTRSLSTRLDGQLAGESWSGGPLNGWSVTTSHDSKNRRTGRSASVAGESLSETVAYDNLSRISSISSGLEQAVYSYVANTSLINGIGFKHSGTAVLAQARAYDLRDRLTGMEVAGITQPHSHEQTYNRADQKTRIDLANGDYWTFGYDDLGQVTAGAKNRSAGGLYAGLQFAYTYDGIGNRQTAEYGGDASGSNKRQIAYTADSGMLNQYASVTQPGYVWSLGQAHTDATVTVNGSSASRQGQFFWKEESVSNAAGAVWHDSQISATLEGETDAFAMGQWLNAASTSPIFDADGNLLSDGRFTYTWDAENRLVEVQSAGGSPMGAPDLTAAYTYDDAGRRVRKVVQAQTPAGLKTAIDRRMLYDGWNLVAEVDGDGELARSYVWGTDASGSLQGAGGVGGLLFATQHRGPGNGTSAVFADANGNVSLLADMATQAVTASYEYDPFGRVLRAVGPGAAGHPLRFSSKYEDLETGLLYYGYRYLDARQGRWLSPDPLGEAGGNNLYGFVENDAINSVDVLGLETLTPAELAPHARFGLNYDDQNPPLYGVDKCGRMWMFDPRFSVWRRLTENGRGGGPCCPDGILVPNGSVGRDFVAKVRGGKGNNQTGPVATTAGADRDRLLDEAREKYGDAAVERALLYEGNVDRVLAGLEEAAKEMAWLAAEMALSRGLDRLTGGASRADDLSGAGGWGYTLNPYELWRKDAIFDRAKDAGIVVDKSLNAGQVGGIVAGKPFMGVQPFSTPTVTAEEYVHGWLAKRQIERFGAERAAQIRRDPVTRLKEELWVKDKLIQAAKHGQLGGKPMNLNVPWLEKTRAEYELQLFDLLNKNK
jgi:RHS repeat-associated protein